MTHLGVDLARAPPPRTYKTPEDKSRHHHRRLHRFASFLAQILAPLAALFALPALTEGWYVKRSVDGLIVAVKADPPLIIASGAVTLALALMSNLSILFRLIDTHCRVFTFATIGLLVSHVLLSLVSCLVFGLTHQHGGESYDLSTSFFLTVASAAIALVVALALVFDGVQTQWYSVNGTGISSKQCSLIIAFDLFISWLLVGTCTFRYLLDNVNYLDSLYFGVQCMITTGFGDILPTSVGARIWMIAYFVPGILSFAILICFTRSVALEALQDRFKARERTIVKSLKRRRKVSGSAPTARGGGVGGDGEREKTRDEKLVASTYEAAIVKLQKERNRDFRSQLLVSLVLSLAVWLLSALVYSKLEGWTYFEAFYFCFICFSTIGLGDLTPKTEAGRAFFCVFALLGVGVLTVFFSILADGYSAAFKETFQRNVLAKLIRSMKAKKDSHLDNDAEPNPTVSTLAQIVAYREDESNGGHSPKNDEKTNASSVDDTRAELLRLVEVTRQQLNHLIVSGGDGDSKEVTRSVRDVMKEHKFKRRNREKVECDAAMKQFLYLRSLQAKFAQVEELTKQLCDDSPAASPDCSSWNPSSDTMAYSSSSESTLGGGEARSRTKSVSDESIEREETGDIRGRV